MGRPLALSETETWMRDFRARMRLQRPTAAAGARNGRRTRCGRSRCAQMHAGATVRTVRTQKNSRWPRAIASL